VPGIQRTASGKRWIAWVMELALRRPRGQSEPLRFTAPIQTLA